MKIIVKDDVVQVCDFNNFEAYKIAKRLEEDGVKFYQELIKLIKKEEIKKEIMNLLKEEEDHLKFFGDKLTQFQMNKEDGFEEDDVVEYININIFEKFEELKKNVNILSDPIKVLKLGVLIEKVAISFYESLLKNTTNQEGKVALKQIIKQEIVHKEMFEKFLKK